MLCMRLCHRPLVQLLPHPNSCAHSTAFCAFYFASSAQSICRRQHWSAVARSAPAAASSHGLRASCAVSRRLHMPLSGWGGGLNGLGPRGGAAMLVVAAVLCWVSRHAWGGGRGWMRTLRTSARSSGTDVGGDDASKENPKKATGVPASEWEKLSEEERMTWRSQRESEKAESKLKLQRAFNSSSPHAWKGAELEIVFDLSYGASSTDNMNRSLAKQLAYAYSYAKNTSAPYAPAIHITSYLDAAQEALEKRGSVSWMMHKHAGSLRDVFKNRLQDLIYLSPDANETLHTLEAGKVYVIGGIVDRTVSKGLSLQESAGRRSGGDAIRAMRLPIDENIPRSFQGRGHVLNINTVVHILMEYKERLNWEDALTHVMYAEAPARFRESIKPERRALVDGKRPPPKTPVPNSQYEIRGGREAQSGSMDRKAHE